ncbi:MAG TPA: Smr/MutS family protein [Gemmatimonadaceae bacterium]
MRSKSPAKPLDRAFDIVRFGESNILNLREGLPSTAQASERADRWLRQRQVEGIREVLVITGRGKGSDGGIGRIREAILRLIGSLRRQGVIDRYEEHTEGSITITLATVQSMIDAPRRRRESRTLVASNKQPFSALGPEARRLLRELAERTLTTLGVKEIDPFIASEMQRHLDAISAALPDQLEDRLVAALRAAIDENP